MFADVGLGPRIESWIESDWSVGSTAEWSPPPRAWARDVLSLGGDQVDARSECHHDTQEEDAAKSIGHGKGLLEWDRNH